MKEENFENLLNEAYRARAEKFNLRSGQLEELFAAAKAEFNPQRARRRERLTRGIYFKVFAAVAVSGIAACLVFLSYNRGAQSAEFEASIKIAQLQAELEKTKEMRAEFAKLVELYGKELITQMTYSNLDYETAFLVAEENYVKDMGSFREDFRLAIERAKADAKAQSKSL